MLVAIVGATGTGKSAFSLAIAEALVARGRPVEVVNADAMQLYRGMDIGTAKLPVAERRGIPHHLLDVLDVTDEASVEWYQREARAAVDDIVGRGAVAVLVGGSGLYVSSVLFDFRFPGTDAAVRARYEAIADERGAGALYDLLAERDPASAASIGRSNARRLVRALEVGDLTGRPLSGTLPESSTPWRPSTVFGVAEERPVLVERLDRRVGRMWQDGLVDEVRGLLPLGLEQGVTAGRAIGYAQAAAQVRGQLSECEAIEATAALTRRYARRQASWFRRYDDVEWSRSGDAQAVDRAVARLLG
ncbi:tRNA (adenosine(37)-N6)-dimethylallyltransferase MiaA [Frigoribacterium sp. Leaf186]|uniref:tRNA (adenosine(37)-N6)-dimethylallyltransferase MiaA n=1 Tax=Frigoribacterium sp. Leaf186 TaxID=1736293 RepID=UPI0006FC6674|nr:tRNA (adenosine(37)-N6)-dimethylallyltransferase MiaA [Frigoribacterium sp. Leaf186]KQS15856.1 tRNA dimethylallyltransferase [Frigoribacterium sp. Leaf186]